MNLLLGGAIAMACFVITLYFVRFWKTTGDRFFLWFGASFFIEGCERIILGLVHYSDEQEPLYYLTRLVAFCIIIYAILDKNGWLKGANRKGN